MALQVWLPLINDLDNRGLYGNFTMSTTGGTSTASGLMGTCYSFDGTDDNLYYTVSDKSWWGGKEISFAFWFKSDKVKANGTIVDLFADLTLFYTYASSGLKFGYWRAYTNGSGNRTGDQQTGSVFYSADSWHHVAGVFDHQYNRVYVDGQLLGEWDSSSKYTANWVPLLGTNYNKIAVGRSYGSNSFIGGLVNDVRIYDHALSLKEVCEAYEGLVTHYTFGQSPVFTKMLTENLQGITLEDGSKWVKLLHHDNPSVNMYTTANCKNNEAENLYSKLYLIETDANFKSTDGYYEYLVKEKPTSASTETTIRMKQTSNPATTSTITGVQIVSAGTAPASRLIGLKNNGSNAYMHNGASWWCAVGSWKSYNGGIPGFSDTVTTGYLDFYMRVVSGAYGNNVIYDSSGDKNNGTLAGSTTVIETGSPRYDYCIHLKSDGDIITIPLPKLTTFTYAFWFKRDRVSQSNREMLMTGWYGVSFELNSNNTLTFKCACTSSHTQKNVTSSYVFSSTTEWYHVAFTHTDGVGSKIYVNGVLDKTASFTELLDYTSATATIGNYTNSYQFLGQYSDFRIYATELSADDIKGLYNVGASVDNNGNMFCYGIEEV